MKNKYDTMEQTVSDLIKQFELDIKLPPELLGIVVSGKYTEMSKETALLNYVNTDLQISMADFEVYVISGEDCRVVIAPTNKLVTVSVYHKLNDIFVGQSYDWLGYISAQT